MRILNATNNVKASFSGISGDIRKPMDDNEKMILLTKEAFSTLQKRIEYEVPENGHFRTVVHIFDIPNTQNEAVITVKHNKTASKDKRVLTIGTKRCGSDKETSNIIKEGSKEEIQKIITELKLEDVVENLNRLSEKTDKIYSE